MSFSKDSFKQLEQELHVKQEHMEHVKATLLQKTEVKKAHRNSRWHVAVVIVALCLLAFPLYSTTLANIAAKVKPLVIGEQGGVNNELITNLHTYLIENGFHVSSVGILTKENVIEIGIEEDATIDSAKLQLLVESYVATEGYDLYSVELKEIKGGSYKGIAIYEEVRALVKDAFAQFGYAKEADYELMGLQKTLFSHNLTLDMPDHIAEHEAIVATIENEIEARDLPIKKVDVQFFNLVHQQLDGVWGYVSTTIYNAMAGQSTYALNGLSYSVSKKGHATIKFHTAWNTAPSPILKEEIETTIKQYMESEEVMELLPTPSYTMKFYNVENEVVLTVSP